MTCGASSALPWSSMAEMRSVISDGVAGKLVATSGARGTSIFARPFQPLSTCRSFGKSSRSCSLSGWAGAGDPPRARTAAARQADKDLEKDVGLTDTVPGVVLLYLKTTILAVLSS